jgi:hypothetical protein
MSQLKGPYNCEASMPVASLHREQAQLVSTDYGAEDEQKFDLVLQSFPLVPMETGIYDSRVESHGY